MLSKIKLNILKFNHINFFSLLLILIPPALITGPFFPDFFLSLLAIYFLVISFKNKIYYYYNNIFVKIFIFFYLYILVRGIFSEFPYYALIDNGTIFYFRYILFALAVCYLLNNNKNLIIYFLFSLLFSILLITLDGLYQYFNGANIIGWKSNVGYRLTSFFGQEYVVGQYLSKMSMLFFALVTVTNYYKKPKIFILFGLLILIESVIFLSGERAAFFHISLFAILVVILANNHKILRLITSLLTIFAIYIILKNMPIASERMVSQTIEQMSEVHFPLLPYSKGHEDIYITTLKMFLDSPIFGLGPNLFDIYCGFEKYFFNNSCTTHPHNHYIQMLGELGLVGFGFLLTIFLYLTYRLALQFLFIYFKTPTVKKTHETELFLIIFYFVMLWPIIPNNNFFGNWINVQYYLPLGFLLYFIRDKKI